MQSASAQSKPRSVIVLVVPGLTAEDLTRPELPGLRALAANSAVGWMNTRTARVPGQTRDTKEAAYLTLGSGARATAGPYARVVNAETMERLIRENARLDHPVHVGLLGDLASSAGLRFRRFGSEDDVGVHRSFELIAAPAKVVTSADELPGPFVLTNPDAPFGVTDPPLIAETTFRRLPLVCMYGDLIRAERYAPLCLPDVRTENREQALHSLDLILPQYRFAEELSGEFDDVCLVLLAPIPSESSSLLDHLAPILIHGKGIIPGLLTSPSTRTPGLVTNTDFLPTVAAWLNLKTPPDLVGRPMYSIPRATGESFSDRILAAIGKKPRKLEPAEEWAKMHDDWLASSQNKSLYGGLPSIQLVIVLACTAALTAGGRWRRWIGLSLAVPLIPLACLMIPAFGVQSSIWAGIILAGILAACCTLAIIRSDQAYRLEGDILTLMMVITIIDLLAGARLMRNSWFSYSVMEAARYYGLGNEMEGVIVAAMLVITAFWSYKPYGAKIALGFLIGMAVIMALPNMGADAGGMLGMFAAAAAAGLVWLRGKIRSRDVLFAVLAVSLAVVLLVAADLVRSSGAQSHIGRAFAGGHIVNIAARKLQLNFFLLTHSIWSLCLIASAVSIGILWRLGLKKEVLAHRGLTGSAVGIAVGAAVLLICNDSGVVSAAECLLIAWAAGLQLAARSTYCESTGSPAPNGNNSQAGIVIKQGT